MNRVSIDVIGRYTRPWPSYEPRRYYVEFWKKKFAEHISEYNKSHGIHSRDKEIAVYYDLEGILHIDRCSDSGLERRIRGYMEHWYEWICRKEFDDSGDYFSIQMLLTPYISELKDGFYQIRYLDYVCNISQEQKQAIDEMHAVVKKLEGTKVVIAKTGIPRLDIIIEKMIYNGDIFPYKGPDSKDKPFLSIGDSFFFGGDIF